MRGTPLWLAEPTRFAALPKRPARGWLAALAIASAVAALGLPGAIPSAELTHQALVAAMRQGAPYYDTLHDLMRSDPGIGADYLLPPALTLVTAVLPAWAMLGVIALALTALLWSAVRRIGGAFVRTPGSLLAAVLALAGVLAGAILAADAPHAGWAAILVALALLWRTEREWIVPCALGCVAAIVDPAALLAIGVFGLLALVDARPREAGGWLAAGLVAAGVLAAHLHALAGLAVDLPDRTQDVSAAARMMAGALPGLPAWLAAPAILLSAFGWAAWNTAIGLRAAALMGAGAIGDTLLGLHGATLTTILVAPGLAFVPDALADLWRAAGDRRRITVTRIVR